MRVGPRWNGSSICTSKGCRKAYIWRHRDDIPGLVAQGRTVAETLEIARDIGTKLLEAQSDRQERPAFREAGASFDHPLVIGGY